MRFKPGVKIKEVKPEMLFAAMVADEIWREFGRPEGVTITSVTDGKHSKNSLHYEGLAIDLRTRYFNGQQKKKAVELLKQSLTDEFDVVLERTHIHVEHDTR
ncbi:MAG: hypothetical protein OQK29_06630 [Ignavibacteriaceae bacterium]|nr:hypothetical protein [Ignavibacteriaceae bacterium]